MDGSPPKSLIEYCIRCVLGHFHSLIYLPLQDSLQYTVNINVTSFEDNKRQTHNPIGKVYPSTLWQYFMVQYSTIVCISSLLFVMYYRMAVQYSFLTHKPTPSPCGY